MMLHIIQLFSSFPDETSTDLQEYYSAKGFCSSAIAPDVGHRHCNKYPSVNNHLN